MSHQAIVTAQRHQRRRNMDASQYPNQQPRNRGTDDQYQKSITHQLKQLGKLIGLAPNDSRTVALARALQ